MEKYMKPAIEMMAVTEETLLTGSVEGFDSNLDNNIELDPKEMLIRGNDNPLGFIFDFDL